MEFSPLLSSKRRNQKYLKNNFRLLPVVDGATKIQSKFAGICVEVDWENGMKLHQSGGFGQMQGESKIVLLSFEEAFFLCYFLDALVVTDGHGNAMQWQQLLQAALIVKPNFVEHFAAYLYLRSKAWVVKIGIKFGGDFLIYKHGPSFYHASFVVLIETALSEPTTARTNYTASDIKGHLRVAEAASKDVLLLNIVKPHEFQMINLEDLNSFKISETILRRFPYTSFVQKQQKQPQKPKQSKKKT